MLMYPIESFDYDNNRENDIMLFKMASSGLGLNSFGFVIGYYNKHRDVFEICPAPGYLDHIRYGNRKKIKGGRHVVLPSQFERSMGPRVIESYVPLDDAIDELAKKDEFIYMDKGIPESSTSKAYIVILKDGNVMISSVRRYEAGEGFTAVHPTDINKMTYDMYCRIEDDIIKCYAGLK